ncbi:MAG: hypothetical protein F2873_07140, partial [Actinobacteria bacterium]|nr:hypothetical protein [Actinomycetota bacterium]
MRNPSDIPSRRPGLPKLRLSSRGRIAIAVGALVLIIALFSGRGVASFYVDSLWFRSVGRSDVFWGTFWVKVVLAAVGVIAFAVMSFTSLTIADRIAPEVRIAGPQDEVLDRVRRFVGARRKTLRLGLCA